MRFRFLLAMLLLLPILPISALAEDYRNPMNLPEQYAPISSNADSYGIGDPFVMRHNGMYYLYASSSEDRVRVWTSRNLVDWTFEGHCTQGRDVYFAYAPEVVYWRGSFYMITSPSGAGHYILKSESPLGPFVPVTANFGHSIDGSFFKLDDGGLMMLCLEDWKIKSVMLDEKTLLPGRTKSDTGATLRHWTEGPGLFRRGDWYYLTFTGNHVLSTGYKVAWASRKGTPRGAFSQREESTLLVNSVLKDDFTGLGHSANVVGPDLDSMYTTYHNLVSLNGPARQYNLDRLFTNEGLLYTSGPSNTPMPIPKMPDVWGDAADDLNDFIENTEGCFADIPETARFTQEWCFTLNSGEARVLIGDRQGKPVTVTVDDTRIRLFEADSEKASAKLPPIGAEGCLHTLRVENTPEILYLYIDDMRVLTEKKLGLIAAHIGAYHTDGVHYSFMACTAEALGSSDNTALKLLPGGFSAVHALNRDELDIETFYTQDEAAPRLGKAEYNVRIAEEGIYAFDLTVSKQDKGKVLSLFIDDTLLWSGEVPTFNGRGKFFTFTTDAVRMPQGDHILTVSGESVLLNRVSAFAYAQTESMHFDFGTKKQREAFYTLGAFTMKPAEKQLAIKPNRTGYALFGSEGQTDYSLDIRFELPQAGNGSAGVLMRATDVSVFDAQVADSYYGYKIIISKRGVTLARSRYGQVGTSTFEAVKPWQNAEEGRLRIIVKGNRVTLYAEDSETPLIDYVDDKPFTHGMFGFFSTGSELVVRELTIEPLT